MALPAELMVVFAAVFSGVENEFGHAGEDAMPVGGVQGQVEESQNGQIGQGAVSQPGIR